MTRYLNQWSVTVNLILLLSFPYWSEIPSISWSAAFTIIAVLLFKYRRECHSSYIVSMVIVLALLIGQGNHYKTMTNTLKSAGSDITIKGEVDSFFKQISHGYESTFVVHQVEDKKLPFYLRPKIRVVSPFPIQLGEYWQFNVSLKAVTGVKNEYGFDTERYYAGQTWLVRATVLPLSAVKLSQDSNIRVAVLNHLDSYSGLLENTGLIKALSLANRHDIGPSTWQAWRDNGILHLIAISGLHIGMIFGFGLMLGRLVQRVLGHRYLPYAFAVVLALGYSILAGFTLPTQRALLMCLTYMLCKVCLRHMSTYRQLLLCALVILTVQPLASLQTSFWLSFGAVLVIIFSFQISQSLCLLLVSRWRTIRSKPYMHKGLMLLLFHLLSTVGFSALSGYYFGGFSAISIVSNLIVVPCFLFVTIPLLFIGLFTLFVSREIAFYPLWLCDKSLSLINHVMALSDFGWQTISRVELTFVLLALFLFSVCSLSQASKRFVGFATLVAALYRFDWNEPLWRFDVFDVGHGTSLLLEKDGKSLLIDTGGSWANGSMFSSVVQPNLLQRSSALDGLVISHFDNDHAGGVSSVLANQTPNWLLSSSSLSNQFMGNREGQTEQLQCIQGKQITWQELEIEMLWPQRTVERPYNPQSCVIRINDEVNNVSILAPGDIDAVSEYLLVRGGREIKSDVLIVPHHGSRTSSTSAFIDAVHPRVAVITTAQNGRWQLPSPTVLERYESRGISTLDTGTDGQLTFSIYQDGSWRINQQRNVEYSPWYRQMLRKGVE